MNAIKFQCQEFLKTHFKDEKYQWKPQKRNDNSWVANKKIGELVNRNTQIEVFEF